MYDKLMVELVSGRLRHDVGRERVLSFFRAYLDDRLREFNNSGEYRVSTVEEIWSWMSEELDDPLAQSIRLLEAKDWVGVLADSRPPTQVPNTPLYKKKT